MLKLPPFINPSFTLKTTTKNELFWGLFFYVGLFITFLIYAEGSTSAIQFDDTVNLKGLLGVHDLSSALDFSLNGNAGPLGRPVALFTFALQAYAWPHFPEILLNWNILIHLLNGVLVTWLTLVLSQTISSDNKVKPDIAILVGLVWLLSPILVSSSLFIIQRMTTLMATFIFMGLIFYTKARIAVQNTPEKYLLKLSFIVISFTLLAIFCKENGALLPLYILAMEITLFSGAKYHSKQTLWTSWKAVFLFAPLVILIIYLIQLVPYSDNTTLLKGFSADDRIALQGLILWEYLLNSFLPRPSAIGPFHDTYLPINTGRYLLGLILFGLSVGLTVLAGIYQRKAPLLSFAILWFFLGHLLESTTIPLELYFEHRNYVPLFGPIFSIIAYGLSLQNSRPLVLSCVAFYLLMLSGVTYMTTSLSGNELLAAEIWSKDNSGSVRSTSYLVNQLQKHNDPMKALNVLQLFNKNHPISLGLQVEELVMACITAPKIDQSHYLVKIKEMAQTASFEKWATQLPERLHAILLIIECKGINFRSVGEIADDYINNKGYQASPASLYNLYYLKGVIHRQYNEPEKALKDFDIALSHYFTTSLFKLALPIAKKYNRQDLIVKWNRLAP